MRFELQELISRTGVTTLYVTHDQSEALAMSDTVAVMSAGRIVQSGAPREVYGRPANRTVADFLGSANFLRGRVIEAHDGLATVALDGGASTIHVPSRAGLAAGAAVDVIFRPEDVTTRLEPLDGTIECVLERVVFQGGLSECHSGSARPCCAASSTLRSAPVPATAPGSSSSRRDASCLRLNDHLPGFAGEVSPSSATRGHESSGPRASRPLMIHFMSGRDARGPHEQ